MPYLSNRSNSTVMSCFRLNGVSRFRLQAGLSSIGVNFTSKSNIDANVESVPPEYVIKFNE